MSLSHVCFTTGKRGCQVWGVVYLVFCEIRETQGFDSCMFGETWTTAMICCMELFGALLNPFIYSNLSEDQVPKHPAFWFCLSGCQRVSRRSTLRSTARGCIDWGSERDPAWMTNRSWKNSQASVLQAKEVNGPKRPKKCKFLPEFGWYKNKRIRL